MVGRVARAKRGSASPGRSGPRLTPVNRASATAILRLQELGPLKDAAMTAWKRLACEGLPSLVVPAKGADDAAGDCDFVSWTDFDDAVRMLSIEDSTLDALCRQFLQKLSYADTCWLRTRARLRMAGSTRADLIHFVFTHADHGGRDGAAIVEDAREAYTALLRRVGELLG
jgi:hypothetical protein